MDVTLYGTRGSPNVQGALIGLAEKGVPFAFEDVPAPFKDAGNMERHPFGRVPSLRHGDFRLYETQAILRYLDAAFDGPSLRPDGLRDMARMDQVIGIVDCYLFRTWSGAIGFERVIAPRFFGREADEAAVQAALPLARTSGEALETLIEGPWLAGEAYSIADIRVLPHYAIFALTPEGQDILGTCPRLTAWFARARERPAVAEVIGG